MSPVKGVSLVVSLGRRASKIEIDRKWATNSIEM
jgi:hypothetical protein